VAASVFIFSLSLNSYLVLSTHVVVDGNEASMVRAMARGPRSENGDLGPYTEWSACGVHFVAWNVWRQNGRYVVVPKGMAVTISGIVLAVVILWQHTTRRR
jgi:hypothetical protein